MRIEFFNQGKKKRENPGTALEGGLCNLMKGHRGEVRPEDKVDNF